MSGGLVATASPRTVRSRLRASRAVRRETPARAGRPFSHLVISSVLSEPSSLVPQAGLRNRRIMYSRLSAVLMPTSWVVSHRSIHSLTVIFPALGSVHWPARIWASWSRPQASAAALVLKPDSLASAPLGGLYLTRHGWVPFPRFSAYAMVLLPERS
jgi:hypothetical protein